MVLLGGKKAGSTPAAQMPRVKRNKPEVGVDGAAVTWKRTGTVLGVTGEDAVYLIQE